MIYPGSTPEFRILVKANGNEVLQLRYVNISQGYTGKWQDVPVVKQTDDANMVGALENVNV